MVMQRFVGPLIAGSIPVLTVSVLRGSCGPIGRGAGLRFQMLKVRVLSRAMFVSCARGPMAEAVGLNPTCCEFESRRAYCSGDGKQETRETGGFGKQIFEEGINFCLPRLLSPEQFRPRSPIGRDVCFRSRRLEVRLLSRTILVFSVETPIYRVQNMIVALSSKQILRFRCDNRRLYE